MTDDPIRVLVVDDTIVYRRILSDVLGSFPEVEVVGTAANGKIALSKIEQLRPDVLTLDVEMPEMDGLEVLRQLKRTESDVGAIMLSGATTSGAKLTVDALELGAFDFVIKPTGSDVDANVERLQQQLRPRVKACAHARHVRRLLHDAGLGSRRGASTSATPCAVRDAPSARPAQAALAGGRREVIALGISTGGPAALTQMLPRLPENLPAPLLIVQHMPPVFTRSLADDLNRRSSLHVTEAEDGRPVLKGEVLVAPGGKQMRVQREGGGVVVRITDDAPENSCRPSVDYLFRSVADAYGAGALGVIMTGMGYDGVAGCRVMKDRGAAILAQDEASCVVFGMPRVPIETGIADVVAPLDGIAAEITRLVSGGPNKCA